MFVFHFAFLIVRILKLFPDKIWEIFISKHTETIEYVKSSLLYKKNTKFTGELRLN